MGNGEKQRVIFICHVGLLNSKLMLTAFEEYLKERKLQDKFTLLQTSGVGLSESRSFGDSITQIKKDDLLVFTTYEQRLADVLMSLGNMEHKHNIKLREENVILTNTMSVAKQTDGTVLKPPAFVEWGDKILAATEKAKLASKMTRPKKDIWGIKLHEFYKEREKNRMKFMEQEAGKQKGRPTGLRKLWASVKKTASIVTQKIRLRKP